MNGLDPLVITSVICLILFLNKINITKKKLKEKKIKYLLQI
jgi:hypothetical protein